MNEQRMDSYQLIGHTKKAYGIDGQLRLHLNEQFEEDLQAATAIFLEIKGQKIPFFVERLDFENGLTLKLEDYNHREAVIPLTNKPVFLRTSDLLTDPQPTTDNVLQFAYLTGYTMVDMQRGKLGTIEKIISYPQQEIAQLTFQGKKVLIPIHPDLLVQESSKEKKITVNLPEGLLELYLENKK